MDVFDYFKDDLEYRFCLKTGVLGPLVALVY